MLPEIKRSKVKERERQREREREGSFLGREETGEMKKKEKRRGRKGTRACKPVWPLADSFDQGVHALARSDAGAIVHHAHG